jgi:uncharacterized protein (DUF302 family)
MVYSVTIDAPAAQVREEMESHVTASGFGVLNRYEFRELLETKGFPIEREITVFEICNPAAAQKALEEHPEVAVYLPCRIALYAKGEKTVLSTIAIEDMIRSITPDAPFAAFMNDIFTRLKEIMQSWG